MNYTAALHQGSVAFGFTFGTSLNVHLMQSVQTWVVLGNIAKF